MLPALRSKKCSVTEAEYAAISPGEPLPVAGRSRGDPNHKTRGRRIKENIATTSKASLVNDIPFPPFAKQTLVITTRGRGNVCPRIVIGVPLQAASQVCAPGMFQIRDANVRVPTDVQPLSSKPPQDALQELSGHPILPIRQTNPCHYNAQASQTFALELLSEFLCRPHPKFAPRECSRFVTQTCVYQTDVQPLSSKPPQDALQEVSGTSHSPHSPVTPVLLQRAGVANVCHRIVIGVPLQAASQVCPAGMFQIRDANVCVPPTYTFVVQAAPRCLAGVVWHIPFPPLASNTCIIATRRRRKRLP